MMKAATLVGIVLLLGALCIAAYGQGTIETVTVGNPGSAGEWSGDSCGGHGPDRIRGAVDYVHHIGKFAITAGQYAEFLNAVAATDSYELYNGSIWGGRPWLRSARASESEKNREQIRSY